MHALLDALVWATWQSQAIFAVPMGSLDRCGMKRFERKVLACDKVQFTLMEDGALEVYFYGDPEPHTVAEIDSSEREQLIEWLTGRRIHRGCGPDCTLPAGHVGPHVAPLSGASNGK